jgi:hypothetical protein
LTPSVDQSAIITTDLDLLRATPTFAQLDELACTRVNNGVVFGSEAEQLLVQRETNGA